jgi:hypothetical protein
MKAVKSYPRSGSDQTALIPLMFDYKNDRRKIAQDVHLCYDNSARGDLAVRFVRLDGGEKFVVLFLEPDRPFESGSVREQIPEKDFETRFVNGKSLAEWIRSAPE